MWGQVITPLRENCMIRIIPTRVGTSSGLVFRKFKEKDHPHACGDKYLTLGTHIKMTGSSPRVWGQGLARLSDKSHTRIIPTRVGTRPVFYRFVQRSGDHPHACGDKSSTQLYQHIHVGSSPRVWGQELCLKIKRLGTRIIPTRVGTSLYQKYLVFADKDHPHACGDKF